MDFQKVVEENFGHKKLFELITMVHEQSITVANAKQVMMAIIDGDERMPSQIAEDSGFVGGTMTSEEVTQAVEDAIRDNPDIVAKILGGNDRPIMSLVGKVMKAVNRRGDPVVVKKLLESKIPMQGKASTPAAKQDDKSE